MEQVKVMYLPQGAGGWGVRQTRHKAQRLLPGYMAAGWQRSQNHGKGFANV